MPDIKKIRKLGFKQTISIIQGLKRLLINENFNYIKKCQISGSKNLEKIVSLGNIPFVNDT